MQKGATNALYVEISYSSVALNARKNGNDCLMPGLAHLPVCVCQTPQVWLVTKGLEWPEEIEGFTDKVQASRGHSAPI